MNHSCAGFERFFASLSAAHGAKAEVNFHRELECFHFMDFMTIK
jgi:hypothetical protein